MINVDLINPLNCNIYILCTYFYFQRIEKVEWPGNVYMFPINVGLRHRYFSEGWKRSSYFFSSYLWKNRSREASCKNASYYLAYSGLSSCDIGNGILYTLLSENRRIDLIWFTRHRAHHCRKIAHVHFCRVPFDEGIWQLINVLLMKT